MTSFQGPTLLLPCVLLTSQFTGTNKKSRFKKGENKRCDEDRFILLSIYTRYICSTWYTPDFNVLSTDV